MTIIMTLVGLVVFAISCFTAGFKSALTRLLMCTGVGLVIDVILAVLAAILLASSI